MGRQTAAARGTAAGTSSWPGDDATKRRHPDERTEEGSLLLPTKRAARISLRSSAYCHSEPRVRATTCSRAALLLESSFPAVLREDFLCVRVTLLFSALPCWPAPSAAALSALARPNRSPAKSSTCSRA